MTTRFHDADHDRARLRATLATLERRISLAPEHGLDADLTRRLHASFDALAQQLALDAEHPVRGCPICGAVAPRATSICDKCWPRLEELGELDFTH